MNTQSRFREKQRRMWQSLSVMVLLAGANASSFAQTGFILFDQGTDTISIQGQTVIGAACTYEVRILFAGCEPSSIVFNEWTPGAEDKLLIAGTDLLGGFSHPISQGVILIGTVDLSPWEWHHVAYVFDGSEERIYADGTLIVTRSATGTVGNGGNTAHIGAIFRDGALNQSFIGWIDTIRISGIPRYVGNKYAPPSSDLASDEDTLLLFNFNDPSGSTTVLDESAGLSGLLGVGFDGATPPELVSEPLIDLGDLDESGSVGIADLLILLASWGQCEEVCCLADLNHDGEVDIQDLLLLLSNWS